MGLKKYSFFWLFMFVFATQLLAQDIFSDLNSQFGTLNSISINYQKTVVVFTSKVDGIWKLHYTQRTGNTWSKAKAIEQVNVLLQPNEIVEGSSFTGDGAILYFSIVNLELKTGDIYQIIKHEDVWSEPAKLPDIINTPALEGSPSVSTDNVSLFFTRLNPDPDEDDYDARFIYLAEKNENGEWKRPYKLPKVINADCEFGPRIMPDGKTLVFSSVRKKIKQGEQILLNPLGDFDFYATTRLAEKIWTEPKHLEQFSTIYNDVFFTYNLTDQEFIAPSIQEVKDQQIVLINKKHVEKIQTPNIDPVYTLRATTKNDNNQAIVANYNVYDPYTSQLIASFQPSDNKSVFICLPNNQNYRLEITRPGFSKMVKTINLKSEPLIENAFAEAEFQIKAKAKLMLNIYDSSIFEPLESRITIINATTGTEIKLPVTPIEKGIYEISFPIGKSYKILISKKAYQTHTTALDLSADVFYYEFERDVELVANTKELAISIEDSETNQALEVDVVVTNLDKNETIYLKAKRGSDGKFKVKLREGDRYKVRVKNPKGYAFYTAEVDMASREETSKLDVELVPLKPELGFELNINFEYNSAELRKESYEELKEVVKLLEANPELKVQISAHSDDKGTDAYNLKLSERRAESVVAFLTENGLLTEKLIAKGFGESKPLVPNTSEENRAKNRRVELEVLEAE